MQRPDRAATTIAILGADAVVGGALGALLEGFGYQITPIDSHPTEAADGLLEGADLLLLVPRLDEGAREAFVGAIGERHPSRARTPVIALFTPLEEAPSEGAICVPWPSAAKALIARIEAALAGAPAAPADPTADPSSP